MEIVVFIVLFLVLYVYIVKATLRGFTRSRGFFPTLFWGVLFLGTLSFLFGSSSSGSSSSSASSGLSGDGGECQDDDFFDTWSCDDGGDGGD